MGSQGKGTLKLHPSLACQGNLWDLWELSSCQHLAMNVGEGGSLRITQPSSLESNSGQSFCRTSWAGGGGGYLMFCCLLWGVLSTETEAFRADGLTQSFTQVTCRSVNYVLQVTHCNSTMRSCSGILWVGSALARGRTWRQARPEEMCWF